MVNLVSNDDQECCAGSKIMKNDEDIAKEKPDSANEMLNNILVIVFLGQIGAMWDDQDAHLDKYQGALHERK